MRRVWLASRSRNEESIWPINGVRRLLAIAAWTGLAFIAFATLSPIQERPRLPAPVAVEHFGAFALTGALFMLAYPRRRREIALVLLVAIVGLEFAQRLTADRHGRVIDAIEKLAGGGLGIVAGGLAERMIKSLVRLCREVK